MRVLFRLDARSFSARSRLSERTRDPFTRAYTSPSTCPSPSEVAPTFMRALSAALHWVPAHEMIRGRSSALFVTALTSGHVENGSQDSARLRVHRIDAVYRDEHFRADVVARLQFVLADHQRVVGDRRADQTDLGTTRHPLHSARRGVRCGRLAIRSAKSAAARGGRLVCRQRTDWPGVAPDAPTRGPRGRRRDADRHDAHRLVGGHRAPGDVPAGIFGGGIRQAIPRLHGCHDGRVVLLWCADVSQCSRCCRQSPDAVARCVGAHQRVGIHGLAGSARDGSAAR